MTLTTMGFVGLGNIGKPMASTLLAALKQQSIVLKVYDINHTAVAELVEQGAIGCRDLADLADCQIVGLCVRGDDDVDDLITAGLFDVLAADAIVAVHSTVTRDNVLRWHQQAKDCDIHLLDAPITGGAQGAKNGTLCMMVGADQALFRRVAEGYSISAKQVIHTGDVGSGVVFKLANNMMTYAQFAAISEAVALVTASGLNPETVYQIGEANGVVSAQMKTFISNREMLAAGCSSEDMNTLMGPFVGLAEKDLDHALVLADQLSLSLDTSKIVRRHIRTTFLKNTASQDRG
ncbi:putative oxidoreductase [Sinobacterium norvegicum]|uniref:Oxidoreductase n=1 Tax=Sinobacterium norvegicum TaxID=1641715 RepID=A0ABM9ACP5_9GAMM|nr:NAD(P)-dependent oxidoreductase [Sinobacterium norvegicum]CAH0990962.1 putative oxidoreductase [Sinobacterium norvegicum]